MLRFLPVGLHNRHFVLIASRYSRRGSMSAFATSPPHRLARTTAEAPEMTEATPAVVPTRGVAWARHGEPPVEVLDPNSIVMAGGPGGGTVGVGYRNRRPPMGACPQKPPALALALSPRCQTACPVPGMVVCNTRAEQPPHEWTADSWSVVSLNEGAAHAWGGRVFVYGGGGVDRAPPPSPKKDSIDRTPKILPSLTPGPWR